MKKIVFAAALSAGLLAFGDIGEFAKKVSFTIEYEGAGELSGIPVLVKLAANSPVGFSYSDCAADGSDIRFTDANDEAIPFEIDTWNTEGESLVWVKPTSLAKGTTFVMYYKGTPVAANDPTAAWTDYTGVWHFGDLGEDKTSNSKGLFPNSTSAEGIDGHLSMASFAGEPGKFGSSFCPNDATDYNKGNFNDGGVWVVDSGEDSPLDANGNLTISGWIKHRDWKYYNNDKIFFKRLEATSTTEGGFIVDSNSTVDNNGRVQARSSAGNLRQRDEKYEGSDPRKDWLYVTVAFTTKNNQIFLYENGVEVYAGAGKSKGAVVDNNAPLVFGNTISIVDSETGAGANAWNGWIDEVRYSTSTKSAEWIAVEYATMTDESFLSAGTVENIGKTVAAKPAFDPEETVFYPSISVTINCATEGATIWYTTDGSDPTTSGSRLVYSEPLVLSGTTTVKAFATKEGLDASDIASATYTNEGARPPVPGDLQVKAKVTNAVLHGTIADLGNNGATACDVYLALNDGEAVKIAEGVTEAFEHVISDLAEATTYSYVLTIRNNAATPMEASADGSFTTLPSVLQPGETPAETRELIQEMIDVAAGESPAGTVTLGEGTFEIDVQLMLTNGVTLVGQGWKKTIVRQTGKPGVNDATKRCMTIAGEAALKGVTLTGGKDQNNGSGGGGVYFESNGTISGCRITGNTSTSFHGGGVGIGGNGTVAKIDHTIIDHNEVTIKNYFGGGIGTQARNVTLEVDTCLICANTCTSSGGGIGFCTKAKTNWVKASSEIRRLRTMRSPAPRASVADIMRMTTNGRMRQ